MKKCFITALVIAMSVLTVACGKVDSQQKADELQSENDINIEFKGDVEIRDNDGAVIITTQNLTSLSTGTDENSNAYVELVFDEEGKNKFYQATLNNIGTSMKIYVDGQCISEPTISSAIPDGVVYVTGFSSLDEAKSIENAIREGQPEAEKITELKSQQSEDNLVAGKVYAWYQGDNEFDFEFIIFYNDNTFQGVRNNWTYNKETKKRTDNYESTYGTYELNKSALTLAFGSETYSGAVTDEGKYIKFGEFSFSDITDGNHDTEFLNVIQ